MLHRGSRAAIAAGTFATALIAVAALAVQQATSHASGTYPILITASGFNPSTCITNRNYSTIVFQNNDTKPHRVVIPLLPLKTVPTTWPDDQEWRMDTGVIPPGGSSSGWFTNQVDDTYFYDYDNPSISGHWVVPLSNSAQSNCTPGATATPTRTATATATPTTPGGGTAGCARYAAGGCLTAINVASDKAN
jgi:hypothetical protein